MAKVKVGPKKPPVETKVQQKVQRVPIGCIFLTEFSVLETPQEKQKEIVSKYEEYVKGLMNCVSVWLGFGEAEKADSEKLAEAVRKADERELFSFLSDVFHKDFKASFERERLVVTSIEDNIFNCYSATVLLADVLTRLGKEVTIIILPDHVLLRGEEYALDTTVGFVLLPKDLFEMLPEEYSRYQEVGVEMLLSITYDWCGVTLHAMRSYEEALKYFDKAIELNPNFAGMWFNKGVTLSDIGKYEEALEYFDKAIELNPDYADAWNNKGFTLSAMGKHKEALESFNKAIELNQKLAEAWFNKGITLYAMGKHKEAHGFCNKAIELNQKLAGMWLNSGNALRAMGNYEEALKSYNEAIKLNPDFAEAWNNKGFTLSAMGKYEEALKCFDKAIELNPDYAKAWFNKGITFNAMGKPEKAKECFDKAFLLSRIFSGYWRLSNKS